jgi:hypothetical protein
MLPTKSVIGWEAPIAARVSLAGAEERRNFVNDPNSLSWDISSFPDKECWMLMNCC